MEKPTDPAKFARLGDGTRVYFGPLGAERAEMKLLENANAIGETGQTGGFVELDRLIDDDQKKYMADIPDAPDKEFAFIDATDDTAQEEFLDKANKREPVTMVIEFPNGRIATMDLALAGWKLQAIEKGKPMMVVVPSKQNSLAWSKQ